MLWENEAGETEDFAHSDWAECIADNQSTSKICTKLGELGQ